MAKTRRARARARRAKARTRAKRGGGPSCYKTDKHGTIKRTWSCTTQCGKDGECEEYD